ncbi:hypothetical protein [Methylovulum miyakonense]|uniref:hypothetical protein n=1 Tax=Methylovulum miyakonense TaxID=645578 RepID=UPI00037DE452|nr:hypothetical protein [Methylovulum miyakonense]
MKRTSNRKLPKKPLHGSTRLNDATEEIELADLRAIRDDAAFMVTQTQMQDNEEDAIDRLLANTGFDNPVNDPALQQPLIDEGQGDGLMSTADDFEPDMERVFMVGPIEKDPHLLVQPLAAKDTDRFSATENGLEVIPTGIEPLVNENSDQEAPIAEPEFNRIQNEPVHNAGIEQTIPPVTEPEAVLFAAEGLADEGRATEIPGQFEARREPIIEPIFVDTPVHTVEDAPVDIAIEPESLLDSKDDDDVAPVTNDMDERWQGQDQDAPPIPQTNTGNSRQMPEPSPYNHGLARINLITLILSIAASLSTIVLYFILMDMRHDLVKLNEMIEIMKEDIQMDREEPPIQE